VARAQVAALALAAAYSAGGYFPAVATALVAALTLALALPAAYFATAAQRLLQISKAIYLVLAQGRRRRYHELQWHCDAGLA